MFRVFVHQCRMRRVKELDYMLSPGRYVGTVETEDDHDFAERFAELKAEFETQVKEEAGLNKRILENLNNIEYEK